MITINAARSDADLVKPWALELLNRIKLPTSDRRAGITHPSDAQATALAAIIAQVPVAEIPWAFRLVGSSDALESAAARDTARNVYAVIPVEPEYVGFAETVNALADTAQSSADWAHARDRRTIAIGTITESLEDAKEIVEDIANDVKNFIEEGGPGKALSKVAWIVGGLILLKLLSG